MSFMLTVMKTLPKIQEIFLTSGVLGAGDPPTIGALTIRIGFWGP